MSLKEALQKYVIEKGLQQKMTERKIKIEKVVDYVTECARKELDGKNGAISDEVVYGWAVHYIEDAYKENAKPEKVEDVSDSPVEEETEEETATPKEEKKEEKRVEKFEQLSLFDMIGEDK